MTPQTLLTKSRYVMGLNCKKAIWLAFNNPSELPKVDEAMQHRFDEGHKVGELSKSLFPEGIEVNERIPAENDKKSKELLKKRKPLFEAGFMHEDGKCYARADILIPVGKNEWDIIEVKSASEVKEEYFQDISFQKYCYESAGLKIRKCFVLHINGEYVRKGKVEAKEFFVQAEITEEIEDLMPSVPEKITTLLNIINLKRCPEISKGEDYHEDDYKVHDNDLFWKEHPECDILDLYYGGKKAIELFNAGTLCIKDMAEEDFTSRPQKKQQKIQHKATTTGECYQDKKELTTFIKSLKYPLYFMDFETYATAIPLYDGLKPYQAIPFQFSVHVIAKEGSKPQHHSFIASGSDDPRIKFTAELKEALSEQGTILVYYQPFEKSRLKEIAEFFPENTEWVESVFKRIMDLYDPFKNFAYYHPAQKGSASLKKVLPALTGKSYDGMDIDNGNLASIEYLFITHGAFDGKKATPAEVQKVRDDLEKYCGQDTEGMVWILDKLKEIVK